MSTDDSISEDVSSSGALSHCHVSADGDGGKESETSLLSSEGTSASGPAVSEGRHSASQTTGGTVESRPVDITPACNKIRSLCLSTEGAFQQGKNLPFINPSSLETLRALVQEIQSSGETDPEIWKDCEGRWLHLFQLVEKQYQGQILAQQEQYQCQIQLIQDEIKALVQLQNRQASVHPHTEFSPTPVTKTTSDTKEYIVPLTSGNCTVPRNVPSESDSLAALAHTPFSSPSPPLHRSEADNQGEEQRATTMLSSGYGTLSVWDQCLGPVGEDEDGSRGREKHHWSTETGDVVGCQQDFSDERPLGAVELNPAMYQQRSSGASQPLTSWAQRQKHRAKKSKAGQLSAQIPVRQEQATSPRDPRRPNPPESKISPDQHRTTGPSSSSLPLKRSDSLMSEASGLTYWRLHESELYRPLPDCFENSALLLLQEASMSLSPPQERGLSLREIYHNKQRTDCKHSDWEGSATSSPSSSPQVLTLDPAPNTRQSDHTSGFTSPSHFSSPSLTAQPHLNPRDGASVSPDSMVECSPNPVDTDCNSNTSSLSVTGPSPSKMQSLWGHTAQRVLSTPRDNVSQQRRASAPPASEEEGSHTLTSTLKPFSASGANLRPTASPHMERASSLEDPVVLSLLRQNLREKHSRHLADLRAYYESEIQILKDQLKLRDLPQDLEKSNQVLAERCIRLEKALVEADSRIRELEATNSSLEEKLAEWPDRYAVAGATVKSLQQRLEESKCSGKEKDASVARLKTRVRQLEEAAQKSCREADEKEARRVREHKMLQDLLGEYDSLMKEHEGAKNKLVSAENKLVDAIDQISEMKRVISKLESQVKQLEHESRARYASRSNAQPSGAGLFHHPDLLLSPGKSSTEPDVTRRKSPHAPPDHHESSSSSSSRRSQCSQTKQSCFPKKSPHTQSDQSSGPGSSVDVSSADESRRCGSPPECEQTPHATRQQEQSQWESGRAQPSCALTPMMRALIELEDTRATQGRAPWVGSHRATVGFVERRHKELIQEQVELQADGDIPGGAAVRAERGGGGGARNAALLRAQRSLSPEGHRSSSLPPPAQRNIPPTTPTKRETLLAPLSAMSSPKRCPTENYSTAFGHMMPREEHLHNRLNGQAEQRRHSFHSSSPRKRLQFVSTDKSDDRSLPDSSGSTNPHSGNFQLGWEEPGACRGPDLRLSCEDSAPLLTDRLRSLAEAEKLFDELTQEKLQIEAALSRMPGAGGRVSLQSRLDEVALENRLERLNRELGSLRMTLKRFHVLRSSANI